LSIDLLAGKCAEVHLSRIWIPEVAPVHTPVVTEVSWLIRPRFRKISGVLSQQLIVVIPTLSSSV